MCVVPASEAPHSGPTHSGGRGVRIAGSRILVDDRTHANLPGMRCPGFAPPVLWNWPNPASYRAGALQNQGAAPRSAVRNPSPGQGLDFTVPLVELGDDPMDKPNGTSSLASARISSPSWMRLTRHVPCKPASLSRRSVLTPIGNSAPFRGCAAVGGTEPASMPANAPLAEHST